jgi:hypothetical protein
MTLEEVEVKVNRIFVARWCVLVLVVATLVFAWYLVQFQRARSSVWAGAIVGHELWLEAAGGQSIAKYTYPGLRLKGVRGLLSRSQTASHFWTLPSQTLFTESGCTTFAAVAPNGAFQGFDLLVDPLSTREVAHVTELDLGFKENFHPLDKLHNVAGTGSLLLVIPSTHTHPSTGSLMLVRADGTITRLKTPDLKPGMRVSEAVGVSAGRRFLALFYGDAPKRFFRYVVMERRSESILHTIYSQEVEPGGGVIFDCDMAATDDGAVLRIGHVVYVCTEKGIRKVAESPDFANSLVVPAPDSALIVPMRQSRFPWLTGVRVVQIATAGIEPKQMPTGR